MNKGYLASASLDQLMQLGKMTSLEHRRHVVDPTLLGLHEVRAVVRVVGGVGSLGLVMGWMGREGGRPPHRRRHPSGLHEVRAVVECAKQAGRLCTGSEAAVLGEPFAPRPLPTQPPRLPCPHASIPGHITHLL